MSPAKSFQAPFSCLQQMHESRKVTVPHACTHCVLSPRPICACLIFAPVGWSVFATMSRSKPSCVVCNTTIQTPKDGHTITSKQLDRLKPYACCQIRVDVDRAHRKCYEKPHLHVLQQVCDIACKDATLHMHAPCDFELFHSGILVTPRIAEAL